MALAAGPTGAIFDDSPGEKENQKSVRLKRVSSGRPREMPDEVVTLSGVSKRDEEFRRSLRSTVSIPVRVETEGFDGQPVSEDTETSVVNSHGGLVQVSWKVLSGQLLSILNLTTGEAAICRVVLVEEKRAGKIDVGFEFVKPAARFWRIGPGFGL